MNKMRLDVAEELTKLAVKLGMDVIVIGNREGGYSVVWGLVEKSIALDVLQDATEFVVYEISSEEEETILN